MMLLLAGAYDPASRVIQRAEGAVRLSPTEARLLAHLAAAPGRAFSKDELLVDVWGYSPGLRSRTVFSTVDRLRRKIEVDARKPSHVLTIDGGYAFFAGAPLALSADLVGRQEDAEAVARLLEGRGARVLLVGPGGVGKSRLARELADALVPDRLPTFLSVDLSGRGRRPLVLHAFARALGLKGTATLARIARAARARAPMLVVLDDLDHLVESDPASVRELFELGGEADLRILATCRVHIEEPGLEVVPLAPLSVAAAQTLLARRAPPPAGAAPSYDQACRRLGDALDRLPLALELAASWLTLVPPDVLLSRLDELSSLVDGQGRSEHHRSLGACVDWSWDLLPDPQRRALGRLAAWRSPLSADAVAELLSDLAPPLALVADLRRRSLIVVDRGGSVRMLETVRRAVQAAPAAAERLLPWLDRLLDRADAMRFGPDHAEIMACLEASLPLVHELLDAVPPSPAQARLIARWVPLQLRLGPDPDAVLRVNTAREKLNGDLHGGLVLELELARHLLARRFGRPDPEALSAVLEKTPRASAIRVEASLELGIVLRSAGRADEAEAALVEAAEHPSATPVQRARALVERANTARRRGEQDRARTLLEGVLADARTRRDPRTSMLAGGALGSVAHQSGEWMEAETHQRRALVLARQLREWDNAAHLEGNLANVLMRSGNYSEALRCVRSSLSHYRSHGHLRSEAYALQIEAAIRFCQDQLPESHQLLEAALEAFRAARDFHGLAYASAFRMVLTVGSGEAGAACRQARRALAELPQSVGAGQVAAVGYIASVVDGQTQQELLAIAHDRLPTTPHADALREALATVETQPEAVVAQLRDPDWVLRALW